MSLFTCPEAMCLCLHAQRHCVSVYMPRGIVCLDWSTFAEHCDWGYPVADILTTMSCDINVSPLLCLLAQGHCVSVYMPRGIVCLDWG